MCIFFIRACFLLHRFVKFDIKLKLINVNWYTIYIQIGFYSFRMCLFIYRAKKTQTDWILCALPNNFNLYNIFGPIDRKQSALLLYREKVAAIYCIEYYYCVMWFVRIVAKFKPNKPHPIFNFLHIYTLALSTKLYIPNTEHIVHQVLFIETIRFTIIDRICCRCIEDHSSHGILGHSIGSIESSGLASIDTT